MLERDAFDRVSELLTPEHFYNKSHELIWNAITQLSAVNSPIDMITVVQQLMKNEQIDEIGGPFTVTQITNEVVSAANIEYHAKILHQKFLRRKLNKIAADVMSLTYDDSIDEFEMMDIFERELSELALGRTGKSISLDVALMEAIRKIEYYRSLDSHVTGIPTGYDVLDRATRGWQEGDLIVLGARPSVGKTAFMLNLVRNAAYNNIRSVPVAVWSLEMDYVQLALRMLSAESDYWLSKLQTGKLSDDDMNLLVKKAAELSSNARVYFDDSNSVSISAVKSKLRKLVKKKGVRIAFIDYLGLMDAGMNGMTREQQVSYISRELKKLATELKIPIILLSQLSREVEKEKRHPRPSDLRESGGVEQDADVIMFLSNPLDSEIAQNGELKTKKWIRIAKQRNGFLISELLDFKSETQQFSAGGSTGGLKPLNDVVGTVKNFYEKDDDPF